MVCRGRSRRVQHIAGLFSWRLRRFRRPGDPRVAAPRPLPPRLRGQDPARPFRARFGAGPGAAASGGRVTVASLLMIVGAATPPGRLAAAIAFAAEAASDDVAIEILN